MKASSKGNGKGNGTKPPKVKQPMGRPRREVPPEFLRAYSLGLSIEQAAFVSSISPDTIYERAKEDEHFSEAINKARAQLGVTVAAVLYQLATGTHSSQLIPIRHEHDVVVEGRTVAKAGEIVRDENGQPVTHPGEPNVAAAIFWSKNVLGWKDRHDLNATFTSREHKISEKRVKLTFSIGERARILAVLARASQALPSPVKGNGADG